MRIQIPDDAALYLLDVLLRRELVSDPGWLVALWEGSTVPDADTVWADLTECSWGGYSRRSIDRTVWQVPALLGGVPTCVYGTARMEWVPTDDGSEVAGWAIIDPVGPRLVAAQRSDVTLLALAGEEVWVWPRLALSTLVVCP